MRKASAPPVIANQHTHECAHKMRQTGELSLKAFAAQGIKTNRLNRNVIKKIIVEEKNAEHLSFHRELTESSK